MVKTERLFIAAPIPRNVLGFLQGLQKKMQRPGLRVRWVPPGNIHLTLQFLGDVDPRRISGLNDQLNAVVRGVAPITLVAKGIGGFPHLRQCRVLWVGLDGETARWRELRGRLAAQLEAIGFARDHRPYHPHLTLARARAPIDARHWGESFADGASADHSEQGRIDQIALFASVLKSGGAEYRCLHHAMLTG